MITTCPKCGHTRSADDDPAVPEGQCPACGVFYFKYLNQKSGGNRAAAETSREMIRHVLRNLV